MAQISGSTKKKTQFVHLENDSGDVKALHVAGIQGERGQECEGSPPPSPGRRQLATFRPPNNSVGRASGQQERPSAACMSLDVQVHTLAGLQGALVHVWGQGLGKCLV